MTELEDKGGGLKYARGSYNTDEQTETFDLRKLTDLVQQEIKKASSSKGIKGKRSEEKSLFHL